VMAVVAVWKWLEFAQADWQCDPAWATSKESTGSPAWQLAVGELSPAHKRLRTALTGRARAFSPTICSVPV